MSEHKTASTTFDKKTYWAERELPSKERNALRRARTSAAKPIDMTAINPETGKQKYVPRFGSNRSRRRRKLVDRQATKKGVTRVIKIDEETNRPQSRFTKIGSRLHLSALANSKRIRKGQARGE